MFIPLPIPDELSDPENLPQDPDPDVIYTGSTLLPEQILANAIERALQYIRTFLGEDNG